MKDFDKLVIGYFIFGIVWNVIAISFLLWRRSKRGLKLPNLTDPDVSFVERSASGSSHKYWYTRILAASNCLTIIVNDSHLAVTTFFPYAAFAGIFDLEHLIPKSKITSIELKGKRVEIEFLQDDQSTGKVSLYLRDTSSFLQTLR